MSMIRGYGFFAVGLAFAIAALVLANEIEAVVELLTLVAMGSLLVSMTYFAEELVGVLRELRQKWGERHD